MKKSNKKGEPFEELSVVTSAGLGKGKRRDKSINKKAGLHDKKADEDETRVFRRKPLAVKHKRRIKKLIPALLAILSIAMVIVITGSYAPPASFEDLDGDFHTVCLEVPDDSSSPEEHTVVETIGYLNYTLQHQPYWSSEMEQSLSALFNIKQNTYNYKKYYNNTLISVDIAKGASTSAKQFCQTDNVVLWRDAVDPGSADGFYADWKQGKPSGLSISEFKKKRGLPPGDFSVYVLNENTIYNAQEKSVVSNGDGTYSVTADLNVNTKGGVENDMCSAVYYYKQQMAVTGGLSQLPSYTYTNVTYTFDENYRVLSFEINDSYEATLKIAGLGEVTSGCTSTTNTVFSYKEEDCKNSVYDYFKDYIHDFGSADDESQVFTVNATNCLAGAFGSVLSDGAVFKLDLGLGGKTVEGVVAVSLKDGGLDGIAAKLGNITVHAVEEQEGYTLYLALGQNKYKYNLGALTLPVSADEGDGDALSDILDALLGGDFVYDSQNGLATLNSEISLSGIDINLNFAFAIDEEKEEISLIDVKANITYGDIGLDATLKFGENKDKPADLTPADKTVYKDIVNDGIELGVGLTLGGRKIDGVAKIDLSGGEFVGVRAKLGEITVHYEGNNLYIASGDNKYVLGLDALGGSSLPASVEFDINSLLAGLLESISIENGIIKAEVFGAEIALDLFDGIKASAYIDMFGGIGLEAYLSSEPVPARLDEAAKAQYTDILNDGIAVGVNLDLGGRKINGVAKIDLSGGEFVGVRAKLGEITVHYEGNNLYIASGDNKYVLGLDALGGSSLPASVEFDVNSLLAGLLESISIENGIIKAEVFGAEIALNLFEGVTVSAYIDMFGGIGLEAYLSSEPVSARLDEAAKAQYTDILNDGIAVGVNLDLGGRKINGVAKIDLSGGEFVGVRAKLGEITVHYEGNNLYIASGDNKYVLGLDALGGSSLPASVEFDVNSLLAGLLESISIENGIIKAEVFGAEIALNLFEGVTVSAYIDMFGGIGLEAYLSSEPVPARLDEAAKAQYTDILNDGIAVGVNLDLGGRKIDGVAKIDLSGGEFVGVRAQLGDALVHYADDNLYISISGSKIRLPSSVLGTATADAGGFELNGIIDDILNGVHIQNGIIYTSLFGAEISLDVFGGIKAAAEFELFGANIKIRAALAGVDSAPDNLTPEQKAEYVNVAEGFSLSGMLDLTLGGEQISLAVNNLAVSFENTFSFKLDTVLLLNNTYNNFYIEYSDGVLTVTYGAISPMPIDGTEVEQNVITVQLDILGGDLEALEEAVVSVYNRVIAVYNEITKQNVKAAGELNDILKTLGIAKDGVDGMSEILEKLALPVADGKLDMDALLKSIVLGSTQDGISVSIGNIFAELVLKNSGVNCGANIKFGTSSFGLAISDVTVSKYQGFDVPCESPLDREGFIQLLDYLGATAEMLLQHNITLNLEGTLYNTEAVYNEYGNIKYIFNALLEYYDGGSMPITFENGQLYVSDEMYLHFKLDLIAQADVDESLYLEVYILDGHPVGTDDSGFTKGGYEKDGGLDFFVSVSKLADGTSGKNSLKFYGSMEEVLSIASMGVTMLNLQDINTTSDKVNETIASIYDFLNGMLIENYIPTVKSQFESLGASLLPNILKTDLSTLLNKIIAEYERIMDGVEHKVEITEGNFIKRAAYADGRIDVALNSATLFGVPEYEDLTFYITKTMGENSLISGLGINNIYFGDNGENKLNLSAGIGYDAISKPDSQKAFEGYHNFEGLDKLLLAAVSSATHETTDEERAAGYFADYKLNNDYCVGGDISLSILGNDIVITINTLHITIDENNEVSFDINLSYNKEKFWGMVNLITDNAMVDISIKKDMVYIRKAIDKGATSYRVMPVNVFMDDMFNQLSYVLSFGDTINKLADQFMSGSSEKIMPTFADYGDYISKFINVYTYSESASEWKITVRGDTLGGMAGMSGLKDITVTINGDGNNLKSLSLNGGLSIISFSGTLDYLNPNEKFAEGKSDLSNNVATLAPDGLYYSWTEILGGETFDEIDKHFMWSKLMGGKTGYLSYAGDGTLTFGGYTYLGASYSVGDGYAIGTLSDLSSNGIKGVKLDAVWMKYAWSISASRSGGIKTGYKYSYTIAINSLNVDVVAKAQVIEEMKLSYSAYGYVTSTSGSESHNGGDQFTPKVNDSVAVGDGHCSLNIEFDTKSRFTSGLYLYGHANLDFSLSCKGYALFSASEHKNQWL